LIASTFIGHTGADFPRNLDVDNSNNVYIVGDTTSASYPTTAGVFDTTYNGLKEGFVSKFTSDLTTLSASTFLAGSNEGEDIVFDENNGHVLVTGPAGVFFSPTVGAFSETHGGSGDAFVAKLTSDLTTNLGATFLGGSGVDVGRSLAIDVNGNPYVTGNTMSSDFPVTVGVYDETFNGGDDVFVTCIDCNLSGGLLCVNKSTDITTNFQNLPIADLVIGNDDFTSLHGGAASASRLSSQNHITFDASGNLWVNDFNNARILKFSAPFSTDMSADLVIGQTDFVSDGNDTQDDMIQDGGDLVFDSSGDLWVVDTTSSRIL